MKTTTIIAAALSMAALFTTSTISKAQDSYTQCSCADKQLRYIEVTGYAETEVAPDTFYLRIDLREEDSKGKKSLDAQQKEMLASLKAIGVDPDKCLKRLGMNSTFYNRKRNMAEASYQLKLSDAQMVSKAWNTLDGAGFSRVVFTKAECSNLEEKKNQLRAEAVKNAREQAEAMAGALGENLGKCFFISGGYIGTPAVYGQPRMLTKTYAMDSMNGMEMEESESVSFNDIKMNVNVNVKFVLK